MYHYCARIHTWFGIVVNWCIGILIAILIKYILFGKHDNNLPYWDIVCFESDSRFTYFYPEIIWSPHWWFYLSFPFIAICEQNNLSILGINDSCKRTSAQWVMQADISEYLTGCTSIQHNKKHVFCKLSIEMPFCTLEQIQKTVNMKLVITAGRYHIMSLIAARIMSGGADLIMCSIIYFWHNCIVGLRAHSGPQNSRHRLIRWLAGAYSSDIRIGCIASINLSMWHNLT